MEQKRTLKGNEKKYKNIKLQIKKNIKEAIKKKQHKDAQK